MKNKDRVKEYNRKYRKEKALEIKEVNEKYRNLNREKINQKAKEFRDKNKKRLKEKRDQHKLENRERLLTQRKVREKTYAPRRAELRNKRLKELRKFVIDTYGGKCVCCGEPQYEFLALDHKNNDGAKHRKEIGIGGTTIVNWIIKNKFPESIQILCHNCNLAKSAYGKCPHETQVKNNVIEFRKT